MLGHQVVRRSALMASARGARAGFGAGKGTGRADPAVHLIHAMLDRLPCMQAADARTAGRRLFINGDSCHG